jgi:hypothetical protein
MNTVPLKCIRLWKINIYKENSGGGDYNDNGDKDDDDGGGGGDGVDFVEFEGSPIVISRKLDDRLYIE